MHKASFTYKYFRLLTLVFGLTLSVFTWSQNNQKILAGDGASSDYFGQSVFHGDSVLIVGAPNEDDMGSNAGAVYIYSKINNIWTQTQKLTADDGEAGDQFGFSVTYTGSYIAIGAPYEDDNGSDAGAVYIFEFNGTSWFQLDKLFANDGTGGETFGYSLDAYSNTIIIGAKSDNALGTNSGSAYIYRNDGFSWQEEKKLLASNGNDNDLFGFSVSIYDSIALIGANKADSLGSYSGAAYTYNYDGNDWYEQQILVSSDGGANDFFGSAVDLYNTSLVIGAYKHSNGAAYTFNYNGGLWTENQKITASDGLANDEFGWSVSLYHYRLAIGCPKQDTQGSNAGAVYLYQYDGSSWGQESKVYSSDLEAGDGLGHAISIHKNDLIYSAKQEDENGNNAGAAYVENLCALSLLDTISNVSCFTGSDGWIMLTPSGGSLGYSYSWSNSDNSDSIFGLNADTFSVTISDSNQCSLVDTFVVSEPIAISSIKDSLNVDCEGNNTAWAKISANGGTSPYTYLWSTGAHSDSVFNLTADTFSVTISDANNCTLSDTFYIGTRSLLSLSKDSANLICNGVPEGFAKVIASNGITPYTYAWNTLSTGDSIGDLSAANYSVTVIDSLNCSKNIEFSITEPSPLSVQKESGEVLCAGGNDAWAKVVASGATAPYNYAWSNMTYLDSISTLSAGTYYVSIQDSMGCLLTDSFLISDKAPLILIKDSLNITCIGDSNGWASAAISGGIAPYSYLWQDSSSNDSLFNLTDGRYYLSITDDNGCSVNDSFNIEVSAPLMFSTLFDDTLICYGDSIALNIQFTDLGTPPYNYLWTPTAELSNALVQNPIAFPSSSTSLTISITDDNNCSWQDNLNIQVGPALSFNLREDTFICHGENIVLDPELIDSGQTPLSYLWTPTFGLDNALDFNPTASPTATTTFHLTVSDSNNCNAIDSIKINVNPEIAFDLSSDTLICYGDSVEINSDITHSGTLPINYFWKPTATLSDALITSPIAKPIDSTRYVFTLNDANNCSLKDSLLIMVNPKLEINAGTDTLICYGDSILMPSTQPFGGTPPLNYLWNPTPSLSNALILSPTAFPLDTQMYIVSVSDQNFCSDKDSITIFVNPPLSIDLNTDTFLCYGDSAEMIYNVTEEGSTPYTFLWSPDSLIANYNGSIWTKPLANTTYSLTILDNSQCQATATRVINVNPPLDIEAGPDSLICFGEQYSFTSSLINGGSGGLSYIWNNASTLNDANILNPTALCTDTSTYVIQLSDNAGCQASDSFILYINPLINVTASSSASFLCYGDSVLLGSTIVDAGTAPYSFYWSSTQPISDSSLQNTYAAPLANSTYFIQITDASNCSAYDSISIQVNPELNINAGNDTTICYQDSILIPAKITGNGTPPISKLWTPFGILNDPNKLKPTAYPTSDTTLSVQITDANGCSDNDQIHISINNPLSISATADSFICYADSSLLIATVGSPGTPPYSYEWAPAAITSSPNAQQTYALPLNDTIFTVTVTDSFNCKAHADVPVLVSPSLIIEAGQDQLICYGNGFNLNAQIIASGIPPVSLEWDNPSTLSDSSILNPSGLCFQTQQYNLQLTDAFNCTVSDMLTISVNPPLSANISADSFICHLDSTSLNLAVLDSGTTPLSYSWSNASTLNNSNLQNVLAGPISTTLYEVTVTDSNNCTTTQTHNLVVNPPLLINVQSDTFVCHNQSFEINAQVLQSGTPPLHYAWDGSPNISNLFILNPTIQNLDTQNYRLTITDSNLCQSIDSFTVYVNPELSFSIPKDSLICYGDTLPIIPNITNNGTGPLSYNWSPSSFITSINSLQTFVFPNANTSYVLKITDSLNCKSRDTIEVIVNPELSLSINGPDSSCFEESTMFSPSFSAQGSGVYQYSWSPDSLFLNSNDSLSVFSAQINSLISLVVTDSNSCSANDQHFVTVNPELSIEHMQDSLICHGDSVLLNQQIIANGTPPLSYQWSNGMTLSHNNALNPIAFPADTTEYSLTVTDNASCLAISNVNINVNPDLNFDLGADTLICFGDSIELSPEVIGNGNGTLSYIWSPGNLLSDSNIANPTTTNNNTTEYSLNIIDANNCSYTDNIVVNVNPEFSHELYGDSFICYGENTELGIQIIQGGTPPYIESWQDSSFLSFSNNTVFASPDSSISVNLTLTDASLCQSQSIFQLSVNPSLLVNMPDDTLVCYGDSLQLMPVVTAYGANGLSYVWSDGEHLNDSSLLQPICTPSSSTDLVLTIIDQNNCSVQDSIMIDANPELDVSIIGDTLICFGDSIFLQSNVFAAGSGQLSYLWSSSILIQDSLDEGISLLSNNDLNISLQIMDSANCAIIEEIALNINPPLNVDAGADTFVCFGDVINIEALLIDSGSGNLSYQWTPAQNLSNSSVAMTQLIGYDSTPLMLLVSDQNNCTASDTIQISTNEEIILDAGNDAVVCYGDSFELEASVNHTNLSYLWTPTALLDNALIEDPIATINDTTIFVLSVSDSFHCQVNDSITLYTTPDINPNLITDTLICFGDSLQMSPSFDYADPSLLSFLWTPTYKLSDATISNPKAYPLNSTDYVLTTTDNFNCERKDTVSLNISPHIPIDAGNDTLVCPNDSFILSASIAQNINYVSTLSWSPSNHLNDAHVLNPMLYAHPSNMYILQMSDVFGCQYEDSVFVSRSPELSFDLGVDELICFGASIQKSINIIDPGAGQYQYLWFPSSSVSDVASPNPILSPTQTTNYNITIVDGNNCSAESALTINVNPPLEVDAGSTTVVCYNDSSLIPAQIIQPGTPPYNYIWTPSIGLNNALLLNPKAAPSDTSLYRITVIDGNNCTSQDSLILITNPELSVFAGNDSLICFGEDIQLNAQITSGQSYQDLNALWTPTANLSNAVVLDPYVSIQNAIANYTITVTDSNQCSASDQITVIANPELNLDLGNDTLVCANTSFQPQYSFYSPSTFATSYEWSCNNPINDSDTSHPTIAISLGDQIVLKVTDHNGCKVIDTLELTNHPSLSVQAPNDTVICIGDSLQLYTSIIDSGQGPYTYLWNNTNFVSNPNIENPFCFPGSPSTFAVQVIDANQCFANDSISVIFNPLLSIDLGADTFICLNDSLELSTQLIGGGTQPYNLDWSQTNFLSDSNILNPKASPTNASLLILNLQDANNCTTTDSILIGVNPNLSFEILDDTLICQGDSVAVSVQFIDAGTPPYSYSWSPSAFVSNTNISNPLVFPNTSTTFNLSVTDNKSCNSEGQVEINVSEFMPKTINGPSIVNHLDTFGYSTLNSNGSSFNWFVQGGNIVSGNGSNTVHVAWGEAGVGKLSFVEINSLGCQSDTISVEISISWGVGVKEANNKTFRLFPNPSNEKVIIQTLRYIQNLECRVYNELGQEVWQQEGHFERQIQLYKDQLGGAGIYLIYLKHKGDVQLSRILFLD